MINPADLEKVEFSVAFRGYNGDQVDDYIDMVVKEFTVLTEEYEKYKLLCERQNEQIKIMRQKILELEMNGASPAEPVAISEPKETVKTVIKTVVDTKINEEALAKAKQLEKLSSEFKAKALELYSIQLAKLEELSFDFNEQDYVIEADESLEEELIADESTFENEVNEAIEEMTSDEPVAETAEKAVEEVAEETIEEITVDPAEETAEETAEEKTTDEITEQSDEEVILSADEIDALRISDNADINNILDELSGLFGEEINRNNDGPVKKAEPAVIQQSFDSLFITSVDDSE